MQLQEQSLKMFIYLSELLDKRLIDSGGYNVGKLADLVVQLGELFPRVDKICIRRKWDRKIYSLPWSFVEGINGNLVKLQSGSSQNLELLRCKEKELLLRDEILDKQVVDTYGSKIERVNDLHLLMNHKELRVVHVDVGIRGILRRLGWIKLVDSVLNWLFGYQIPSRLINWKYVQPLAHDPFNENLKLNVMQRKLSEIHPSDLADIIEELDQHKREVVFRTLDVETAAETLEEVDPALKVSLLETVPEYQASDIIEEMAPDEAVDLLSDLSPEKKDLVIKGVERGKKVHLEKLLAYPEGTAGSIMNVEFVALKREMTVEQALEFLRIKASTVEMFYYLYVVDEDDKLMGVFTLRNLLTAQLNAPISTIMNRRIRKVKIEDSTKKVANMCQKYGFLALPVVDQAGKLVGIITLKDALETMHPKSKER